jgi:hypothetical protein
VVGVVGVVVGRGEEYRGTVVKRGLSSSRPHTDHAATPPLRSTRNASRTAACAAARARAAGGSGAGRTRAPRATARIPHGAGARDGTALGASAGLPRGRRGMGWARACRAVGAGNGGRGDLGFRDEHEGEVRHVAVEGGVLERQLLRVRGRHLHCSAAAAAAQHTVTSISLCCEQRCALLRSGARGVEDWRGRGGGGGAENEERARREKFLWGAN